MSADSRPVIVIAAYGTGDSTAQKTLERIDAMVRARFPANEVRWAFTSRFLVARMLKAGQITMFDRKVPIRNLEQVYEDLRREGRTKVAVQCLMIHDGSESRQVLAVPAAGLDVRYGEPLLVNPRNRMRVIEEASSQFSGDGVATVLVGHGVTDEPALNEPFRQIDEYVRSRFKGVFVATIHGAPGTGSFNDIRISGSRSVLFIPLMITNSEHMLHDVMGDAPGSWKNQLGLPASLGVSLGDTPAIVQIYLDDIATLLGQFQK